MTDAETTVRFAILSGIVDQWHKKDDPRFAEILAESVFNYLFAPHLKWATEEYVKQISNPDNP